MPKKEEAKVPDDGPALPDLDDLAADLAKLEAGMSGPSDPVMPSTQPPIPDMNFGISDPFSQPQNFNINVEPPKQAPIYQPQQPAFPQPVMP